MSDINDIVEKTLNTISQYTDISIDDILSKKRNEEVVEARFLAIYILRIKYNISYYHLKKYFNMTKPGICYAVKTFCDKINTHIYLKMAFNNILANIK